MSTGALLVFVFIAELERNEIWPVFGPSRPVFGPSHRDQQTLVPARLCLWAKGAEVTQGQGVST